MSVLWRQDKSSRKPRIRSRDGEGEMVRGMLQRILYGGSIERYKKHKVKDKQSKNGG